MSPPKGFPGDSPHHWAADAAHRDLQDDPRDNLVLGFCKGFNPVVIQHLLILGTELNSCWWWLMALGAAGILAQHMDPKSCILQAQLGWRISDSGIGAM